MGDDVFDTFYSTQIPGTNNGLGFESITADALCALFKVTNPTPVVVSHSSGTQVVLVAADRCPANIAAHVALEGDVPPAKDYDAAVNGASDIRQFPPARPYGVADVPLRFSPPLNATGLDFVITNQTTFSNINKTLVERFACYGLPNNDLTLTNIKQVPLLFLTTQASVHATYDHCSTQFLSSCGVPINHTYLENVGITGNGHIAFAEMNSDAIAQWWYEWLHDHGYTTTGPALSQTT